MAKLYVFDHIEKKHIAYPARVIGTSEITTDHDGHIAGTNEQRKKKVYDVEYETAPAVAASEGVVAKAAKTAVMWGAHRKDDLAHWQGKTYFDPECSEFSEPQPPFPPTPADLPPAPNQSLQPAPTPSEPNGPPKPSKK